MKLVLSHNRDYNEINREGYTQDQATSPMTVGKLKELLGQYDDTDEIVTYELTNSYSGWGSISGIGELSEVKLGI